MVYESRSIPQIFQMRREDIACFTMFSWPTHDQLFVDALM